MEILPKREPAPKAPPLTLWFTLWFGVWWALDWEVESGERDKDCWDELCAWLDWVSWRGGVDTGIEDPRAALLRYPGRYDVLSELAV